MHKYTAKLSLLLFIILKASIHDEGVLSNGVCPEGADVLMELSMEGVLSDGVCPEGADVLMELCMEGVLSEGVLS